MCGICGVVYNEKDFIPPVYLLNNMCRQLLHRGPDERGMHREPGAGLGFQRLSIIDRQSGHQPMANEDKTLWLVCNGEIYNYLELRKMLQAKGHQFTTRSDVEVILHLYEEEGENLLSRLRGMFAFALWDGKKRQLMLARDRLGIKPLYYTMLPRGLAFASEIKALLTLPEIKAIPNSESLHSYLTFRYVPAPETFFQGIRKVKPAHYLIYRQGKISGHRYWDYLSVTAANYNEDECAERLLDLLKQTMKQHLQSEVPVGVFLSSGLDSSTILALAAGAGANLNTFSLGFCRNGQPHAGFWELSGAREIADMYRTRHREIEVSPGEIPGALAGIVRQVEEPLGDPTEIPLYFISRAAAEDVTVVLSGEGADEIFAGYEIYLEPQAARLFQLLPSFVRRQLIVPLAGLLPPGFPGKNFVRRASTFLPHWYRGVGFTFSEEEKTILYTAQMKQATAGKDPGDITAANAERLKKLDPVNQMLYLDTQYWLSDDTLLKADKITMAHALELRVPFLDHRVVEFAASLPAGFKVKGNTLKYILKKATEDLLPDTVVNRKKIGFTAPISSWITTELRPFAEDLLTSPRFLERGYFKPQAVADLLAVSRKGICVQTRQVYTLMVLELWHRLFIDGDCETLMPPESLKQRVCLPVTG